MHDRLTPLLLSPSRLPLPLILPHGPLIPAHPLLPLRATRCARRLGRLIGLLVDLDDPLAVGSLVGALISPLALPLARGLVVLQVLPLRRRLRLDALLGREALPLGLALGCWQGL